VSPLAGRKVLVLEDEPVVAMLVEDMLVELGCIVVGPASRLDDALAMAEREELDLAVLDINLGRVDSFPVAEILRQRSVPFIFATGYGDRATPFPAAPVVAKPYRADDLYAALQLAAAASSPHS
jgi:CheY-like chemotaxis protein